jgi:hypothetical protein
MNLPATFQPTALTDNRPQPHPGMPLRAQLEVTVREARDALARMGATSPEHGHLAAGIEALLVRLDTVRDECLFRTQIATSKLRSGDPTGAQETLANILTICGKRGERHTLTVNARRARRSA